MSTGPRRPRRPQFEAHGDFSPRPDAPASDQPASEPDFNLEQVEDEVAQALDQFGQLPQVEVYVYKWGRVSANEDGWLRCRRIPANEFSVDAIPAAYGYGHYAFKFKGPDEKGRRVWLKHVTETFAAPVGADKAPALPQQPPAPAQPTVGGITLESFMLQQLQQMQTLLLGVIQSKTGSDLRVSDLVALIREGREGAAPAGAQAASVLEAVRTGMELAGNITTGEGGGGSMLEKLAPRMLDLLDKVLKPGAAPVAALPANATPRPEPAPSPLLSGAAPGATPLLDLARRWAPQLIAEASKGRDGYTWGSFVSERVPEVWRAHLLMLAQAEPADRIKVLTQVDPRLADYQEWIDDAAEGIRDQLADGDEDVSASEPATGRGGDLGNGAGDPAGNPRGGSPAKGQRDGRAH